MRPARLALIALAISTAAALGQQPSPDSQHDQPKKQQAAPDNRGTDQIPFVVKELPRERSAEERTEAHKKAELDSELARYTANLARYTKWLFIATCLLAAVTGGLAIAAFLQIREGRQSVAAAIRAADVAERALTELERPFVVVDILENNVRLTASGKIGALGMAKWGAINHGRTPALLVDRHIRWLTVAPNAMPLAIEPATRGPAFPGGSVSGINPYTERVNLMAEVDAQSLIADDPPHRLFFIGHVRYGDLFGGIYIAGFCFVYDTIGRQFVRMGGDRYNYTRTEQKPGRFDEK